MHCERPNPDPIPHPRPPHPDLFSSPDLGSPNAQLPLPSPNLRVRPPQRLTSASPDDTMDAFEQGLGNDPQRKRRNRRHGDTAW